MHGINTEKLKKDQKVETFIFISLKRRKYPGSCFDNVSLNEQTVQMTQLNTKSRGYPHLLLIGSIRHNATFAEALVPAPFSASQSKELILFFSTSTNGGLKTYALQFYLYNKGSSRKSKKQGADFVCPLNFIFTNSQTK